jgi:thioredoxin 1
MKVELFYSPGCSACADRQAELRSAAQEAINDVEWREINVLDSVDHAVELGIMTLPSIVIDGEVAFTSMPTVVQLRKALIERNRGRA